MRTTIWLLLLTAFPAFLAAQESPVVTAASSSYTLRPGDVVRINVWGQPDFSGQFQVNETGMILYPLVGEIQIEGSTVGELRETIRNDLQGIFNQPFVSVTPLFRIAVLGEVRAPGLLSVDPTLSVLDIVALAGGTNPDANINKIRLLRQGEEMQLGLRSSRVSGQTLQEIGIRSGDQIYVPRKGITTTEWMLLIQVAQLALSVAIFINTVN
jgi:polysaccharide biosynthesis/export protein